MKHLQSFTTPFFNMLPIPQAECNLVRDLQAKLPAAFSALYNAYSQAMFGVLVRMVNDHQRAEDLLQDAFIRVWSNIQSYDSSQGRLFTWLMVITKRLALDELRAQKVRALATTYIYERSDELESPTLSEGTLHQSLTSSLATKHRQIVDLLYFQDYTGQEVADTLQIPLGTVKTRYRAALLQLKQSFSHDIHHYHAGNS